MTDSNNDRTCAFGECNTKLGLKKSKKGQWYCTNHLPANRKKAKKDAIARGKKSGKKRREDAHADTFTFVTEPNKASVLRGMLAQVNFLARDVRPRELRRHSMIKSIWDTIWEYAADEGNDALKEQKASDIMESELPDAIKLSKLVDILGPKAALEKIRVKIKRGGHEKEMLDGVELLKAAGTSGMPTISTPDNFTFSENEKTEDVPPEMDLPMAPLEPGTEAPVLPGEPPAEVLVPPPAAPVGDPAVAAAPAPAAPAAQASATPSAPQQPPDNATAFHQARELLGIYRTKVVGGFTPHEKVLETFHQALKDGVPFEDLRQRVLSPRSDTDQPHMMIKDVKARIEQRKATG